MMNPYLPLFEALSAAATRGRKGVFCLAVKVIGSAPQAPGAAMSVMEDLSILGTVGGGCVEAEARLRAGEMLTSGAPACIHDFFLDHDLGWDDGLLCGGRMEIAMIPVRCEADAAPFARAAEALRAGKEAVLDFSLRPAQPRGALPAPSAKNANEEEALAADPLPHNKTIEGINKKDSAEKSAGSRDSAPGVVRYRLYAHTPPRLIIAGGGHVALALAKIAADLNFHISVIDDREEYANSRRFPAPIHAVVGNIESALRAWPIDPSCYIVIVTRGHRHDRAALEAVLDSPARYIGMIGSRRKIKVLFDDLAAMGAQPERLARVNAPIGLPIGSVTPAEIAVSICAQLIQERRKTQEIVVEPL